MIPIKCRLCRECNREDGYCEIEPKSGFAENCDEFTFEPLYLIDYLEELEERIK